MSQNVSKGPKQPALQKTSIAGSLWQRELEKVGRAALDFGTARQVYSQDSRSRLAGLATKLTPNRAAECPLSAVKRTSNSLKLRRGAERLNQHWVGVIEPRGSWCGFTGPRVNVITRNLMTG
jgi:hypothetical protein